MNKRQLATQKTKKKLIITASKLFKEKGMNCISVEDITKEAGVAKGTFYTYFKKKEDIIEEIGYSDFEKISEEIHSMAGTVQEKLLYFVKRNLQIICDSGIEMCRNWTSKNILFEHSDNDFEKWKFDFENLGSVLKSMIDGGELKQNTPIETIAKFVVSEIYGMMVIWCMSNNVFNPLEWTEKFKNILNNLIKDYVFEK